MNNFKKTIPHVDRFLATVTNVERYSTSDYQIVEFSWEGGRYRVSSTGDVYELNYCGIPILIPHKVISYKDHKYAVVLIPKKSGGYYISMRKRLQMRDLIWACFGNCDIPKKYEVTCKDGNPINCKIDNLEVKKCGVS